MGLDTLPLGRTSSTVRGTADPGKSVRHPGRVASSLRAGLAASQVRSSHQVAHELLEGGVALGVILQP